MKNTKTKKVVMILFCTILLCLTTVGVNSVIRVKAATIGQQLLTPESGWKRYNNNDSSIVYTGGFAETKSEGSYGDDISYTNQINSSVSFKFYGTKLRIISTMSNIDGPAIPITIDGNTETFNLWNGGSKTATYNGTKGLLVFEKTGLTSGIHTVQIGIQNGWCCNIDAIDIDDTGYLIDPSATLASGLTLDKTSLDMNVSDNNTLTATVQPSNASNKAIKWTSSDSTVVSVDSTGKITALKEGSATITATTTDGTNLTATCTINVKNADNGNALLTVTMTDGQQRTYDLTMNQVNQFITWYNNRANGQGNFTYSFNKTPSSGAYTKRTEYLIYDKISNYDVDEYKGSN